MNRQVAATAGASDDLSSKLTATKCCASWTSLLISLVS